MREPTSGDATMPLDMDPEKITLLNPDNGQSQADPYATISTPGFVVEKEIVNTAGNGNS